MMKGIPLSSWDEFKSLCIVKKNLTCQYRTLSGGGYDLIGPDAGFDWTLTIIPDVNAGDIEDFETNHKENFNWAVGSKSSPFSTSDYEFMPNMAGPDTCPAGEDKSILFRIDEDCRLNGGKLITDGNAVFGDWVECSLVDHDDLLHGGANPGIDTVLKAWVPKWGIDWKSCSEFIQTLYAGTPPVGMYLKMTYHSVGTAPVGFLVNFLLHRPI